MIIIADSREKDPYTFGDIPTVRDKLEVGDYSISGLESCVAIERKNLDDFVATVIRGKDRFHNELVILARMEFAAIVVEASLTDILEKRYAGHVNPLSVIGAAVAIMVEYRVPIMFCGNRQAACHVTRSILKRLYDKRRAPKGAKDG